MISSPHLQPPKSSLMSVKPPQPRILGNHSPEFISNRSNSPSPNSSKNQSKQPQQPQQPQKPQKPPNPIDLTNSKSLQRTASSPQFSRTSVPRSPRTKKWFQKFWGGKVSSNPTANIHFDAKHQNHMYRHYKAAERLNKPQIQSAGAKNRAKLACLDTAGSFTPRKPNSLIKSSSVSFESKSISLDIKNGILSPKRHRARIEAFMQSTELNPDLLFQSKLYGSPFPSFLTSNLDDSKSLYIFSQCFNQFLIIGPGTSSSPQMNPEILFSWPESKGSLEHSLPFFLFPQGVKPIKKSHTMLKSPTINDSFIFQLTDENAIPLYGFAVGFPCHSDQAIFHYQNNLNHSKRSSNILENESFARKSLTSSPLTFSSSPSKSLPSSPSQSPSASSPIHKNQIFNRYFVILSRFPLISLYFQMLNHLINHFFCVRDDPILTTSHIFKSILKKFHSIPISTGDLNLTVKIDPIPPKSTLATQDFEFKDFDDDDDELGDDWEIITEESLKEDPLKRYSLDELDGGSESGDSNKSCVSSTLSFSLSYEFPKDPKTNYREFLRLGCLKTIETLSLKNILVVVSAIATEKPILFLSKNKARLSLIMYFCQYLLQPFCWESIFIPILPQQFSRLVDSPVPFLCGATYIPSPLLSTNASLMLGNLKTTKKSSFRSPKDPYSIRKAKPTRKRFHTIDPSVLSNLASSALNTSTLNFSAESGHSKKSSNASVRSVQSATPIASSSPNDPFSILSTPPSTPLKNPLASKSLVFENPVSFLNENSSFDLNNHNDGDISRDVAINSTQQSQDIQSPISSSSNPFHALLNQQTVSMTGTLLSNKDVISVTTNQTTKVKMSQTQNNSTTNNPFEQYLETTVQAQDTNPSISPEFPATTPPQSSGNSESFNNLSLHEGEIARIGIHSSDDHNLILDPTDLNHPLGSHILNAHVTIVDLDRDHIAHSLEPLFSLPNIGSLEQQLSQVTSSLSTLCALSGYSFQHSGMKKANIHIEQFVSCFEKQNPSILKHVDEFHSIFHAYWQSIIDTIPAYFITQVTNDPKTHKSVRKTVFWSEQFIQSQKPDHRPFFSQFVSTQMWEQFLSRYQSTILEN